MTLTCSHALMLSCPNATAPHRKRIKHTAVYKSAGKRRQKRFSSPVVSSVELDIWKIILLMMTNKATASSIQLECHRFKKRQHPPCFHALMLYCSLAPMPMLCITKVSSILLHTAAYKSAGKRRQKRFSSQVVSSVELDIWKIILLMQHDK